MFKNQFKNAGEFDFLVCPICRSSLVSHSRLFKCSECGREYPVVDNIPDFYPENNIFSPQALDLENLYEEFGKHMSRKNDFSNRLRKKLILDSVEGKRILEVGCAEGWMTEDLVSIAGEVISCDISMNYLRRARDAKIDAKFIRADSHFLPFKDGYFDCVVMAEVLEHLYSPFRALEEIYRVLANDGVLLLSVPNLFTPSNILCHLLYRRRNSDDLHLNFYDTFSIVRLAQMAGFAVDMVKSSFIYFPPFKWLFMSSLVQNILSFVLPNFGDKIIIKARRKG